MSATEKSAAENAAMEKSDAEIATPVTVAAAGKSGKDAGGAEKSSSEKSLCSPMPVIALWRRIDVTVLLTVMSSRWPTAQGYLLP